MVNWGYKLANNGGNMTVYTGTFGFALLLDSSTEARAKKLSLAPINRVDDGDEPRFAEFVPDAFHVTLFHARIKGAPEEFVKELFDMVRVLVGKELLMQSVHVYGEKFLFWDIEPTWFLRVAHYMALHLSEYLDTEARARAEEEELKMTAEEQESVRRYGHPLAASLFRPHITLGWNPSGFPHFPSTSDEHRTALVRKVVFAEMGDKGRIERIVLS